MKKIAFLGGGKIGQSMLRHVLEKGYAEVMFVYDPYLSVDEIEGIKVLKELPTDPFHGLDLVVESATGAVVAENLERVLSVCDMMTFSMTAFNDDCLTEKARILCEEHGTTLFLPHGAILGLDGISDARSLLTEVSVETVKNPKSLGRDDTERTLLYEGTAREATALYPRNVNVHAAVSLAGIGFDRTRSKIISDPEVTTNSHIIHLLGSGIDFTLKVTSFSDGSGVSGKYVPLSACGSLDRVLSGKGFKFI